MIKNSCVTNNIVVLNKSNFDRFIRDLIETNVAEWFENKFTGDPFEFIYSLRLYPFDVKNITHLGSSDYGTIKVGSQVMSDIEGNINGYNMGDKASTYARFKYGGISFIKDSYTFLDYEPYTKIELYLPYLGFINLQTNLVVGHDIEVHYAIDYHNGACTAFIFRVVQDYLGRDSLELLQTFDGKIGIDFPLSRANQNQIYDNIFATGIQLAAGLITGGVSSGAALAMSSVLASGGPEYTMASYKHDITSAERKGMHAISTASNFVGSVISYSVPVTKGQYSGNFTPSTLPNPNLLYAIVTKPDAYIPSNFNHTNGRPLMQTKTLGDLHGYTVVDSVHLENFECTADELSQIEKALTGGVILP